MPDPRDANDRASGAEVLGGACLAARFASGILEVDLVREPANEIGTEMLAALEELAQLCRRGVIEGQPIRAMVTRSTVRRGFSAGADLRELHRANQAALGSGATDAERTASVRAFLDRIHAVMDAIDEAPFPTVAAVHGVVFGGGLELMLTHDVVVADRTARFAFPELRLGLIPGFGGIPRLKRDLGNAVVRDLLLTGRSLGAERAHQVGLVSQLVGEGQAGSVAVRTAEQITRFDGGTARVAKRFMKHIPKDELAKEKGLFCHLFTSKAVTEALTRFDRAIDAMPYLPARPGEGDEKITP
ncbi:MAG: enoyl-CoA hydratase/isomerase family protein [Deltaproteobacteria bacterium]|nr:enoyl-CoA hydratase/isomerase family protein [Deltaproteobacteria bacterium]